MSIIDRMVDTIAEEQGISKGKAREIVRIVFDEIEDELRDTHECAIPKFGKFVLTEREARIGRNPLTDEPMQIAASVGIRFKPASALKQRFNPPQQGQERKRA